MKMSYDIELVHPITGKTLQLDSPHHMKGGTYAIGGTTLMELNITYNYGQHYRKVLGEEGIRTIYGLSGVDSIPILEKGISQLGDDVVDDYWDATEGNAKAALIQLLTLAKMRPDGVWRGD
jgi:hypothetical protein